MGHPDYKANYDTLEKVAKKYRDRIAQLEAERVQYRALIDSLEEVKAAQADLIISHDSLQDAIVDRDAEMYKLRLVMQQLHGDMKRFVKLYPGYRMCRTIKGWVKQARAALGDPS